MSNSGINRPLKFGERDRREYIVQDSEISLVAINDTNGNPVFLGRSKAGTTLDDDKWQIRFIEFDNTDVVIPFIRIEHSAAATDVAITSMRIGFQA
jgi:hypothetical protein